MRKMTTEEKRTYMLDTPVPRLVTRMALPTIASMLVTSIYNLADTYFVSSLGTNATGAVGVNAAIDNIIMMMGGFVAVGAGSYISRLLGARRDEEANRVLSTSFFTALAFGVIVMVLGLIFMEPMLRLFGATDAVLPYSRQYANYVLYAAPFMTASFVLNQCLRGEGSAIFSMIGMVTGAIINIGLDPLFIFTFGWGIAGASAATAISKTISFFILMYPYLRRHTMLHIGIRRVRFVRRDMAEVAGMGSPSLLRNAMATIAAIVLNNMAAAYGESALAAVSVANRITMFLTFACLGFGMGYQPVVGFSWGARCYHRIEKAHHFAVAASVIGIAVPSLLIFIFARPVMFLFTTDDLKMVEYGAFSLRFQCAAMPLHAWCIMVNMLCAGIGRARGAAILGLSRQGICFFPILPLCAALFGVWGICAVQGVADMLCLALAIPIGTRIRREVRSLELGQADGTVEPPMDFGHSVRA